MTLVDIGERGMSRERDGHISRRTLLAGGAAAASCVAGWPVVARASDAPPHTFKVGSAEVTIVSDGDLTLPASFVLPGRSDAEIAAVFAQASGGAPAFKAEVNVVVVKLGAEVILIDTGAGPDFIPTLGRLGDRLEAAGVKPEAVTRVVFTHAHADHLWGVIDPLGGGSAFEKAEHVMTTSERDFWLQAGIESRVAEPFKAMAVGTHRRLKSIADRVQGVSANTEIVPGLTYVDTAGHTPGHASVLLKSGSDQLLIGGDALVNPVVSFVEPSWRWGSDMDPDRAVNTRASLLDRLASEKIGLIGYHLPWPGLGRVERRDRAYRFVQG
jgi:glyoxylase-like metal-dependent hydrolase (beta-lactamase superfamily II)